MGDPDTVAWLRSRPWEQVTLPTRVRDAPAMISEQERALLYVLARDRYSGEGAIIDAGAFLGGSTKAITQGLRDRRSPPVDSPVHSYDLFLLDGASYHGYANILEDLKPGDSLRRSFEAHVGSGLQFVHVHEGDVCDEHWTGDSIELLFMDLAKSWKINDHVTREFFPALISGRGIIIQQDYVHEWTPWLHITMELLEDAVTYTGAVSYGSALFATNRKITVDEIPARLEDLSDERKLELFERSARRFEGEDRGIVECARAYLLFLLGQSQEAMAHIDRIESEYRSPRMEFAVAGMREGFRALANR